MVEDVLINPSGGLVIQAGVCIPSEAPSICCVIIFPPDLPSFPDVFVFIPGPARIIGICLHPPTACPRRCSVIFSPRRVLFVSVDNHHNLCSFLPLAALHRPSAVRGQQCADQSRGSPKHTHETDWLSARCKIPPLVALLRQSHESFACPGEEKWNNA